LHIKTTRALLEAIKEEKEQSKTKCNSIRLLQQDSKFPAESASRKRSSATVFIKKLLFCNGATRLINKLRSGYLAF